MSLTTHIKNKSVVYHQILANLDISNVDNLLKHYPLVHKPVENTIFPTVGMSVIYAAREYLFGKQAIDNTIASGVNYTPNFNNLAVDAVCNSFRDNFSRKKLNTSNFKNALKCDMEPTIIDVSNIVQSFPQTITHLRGLPYVVNPIFNQSNYVGGADANFIIGDTLYQCITSAQSEPLSMDKVIQVIGYCMLDDVDQYRLKNVAWYLTRQNIIITQEISALVWNVGTKIKPPVNHLTGSKQTQITNDEKRLLLGF